MRSRGLLISTAIVSSFLTAVVVYLVLTVPNDIQAAALLRQARAAIKSAHNDDARTALERIVQQYPRTDAAAAAAVALVELERAERLRLNNRLEDMRRQNARMTATLSQLQDAVTKLATPPPPPPAQPAPQPAPPPPVQKPVRKSVRHHR